MTRFAFRKSTSLAAALLAAGVLTGFAAPSAHAQANVTFTGGSGSPVIFNLLSPVTYTVTQNADYVNFVLRTPRSYADFATSGNYTFMSSLTYTVNGTRTYSITNLVGGIDYGDIRATDNYLYGINSTLRIGDTVTLSAGTLTSNQNIASAAPPSGSYTTFIADGYGNTVATNGTSAAPVAAAVPEPSEYAAAGMFGATLLVGMVKARRKKATVTA